MTYPGKGMPTIKRAMRTRGTPYSFRIKLGSNVNLNAAFSFRSEKYYLGKFAAFCRTRAQ